ncbi:hypothetical protein BMW24_008790 [Mycobacterium heckeshornense]|uniref:bifunctional DNA primase/polymerase n=1 Tax=Mycobacterium heckeshornense TaxID=110505 RepID=UPI000C19693F|nr:AAA family ATPase [Mycobacterium heckeshornense]PIJ35211.1 hypothetical protein BMW24_008790 [Mycobacterium heckeshornense]
MIPAEGDGGKPIGDGSGSGLTADEFIATANELLDKGYHPIAIGRIDPSRPDAPPGKIPWHSGVTGYDGDDADADEVERWPEDVATRIRNGERGILNIGTRMPVGVVGIDVDAYDGKRGLNTIGEHEARLGPLPTTFVLTARPYHGGSGIRLYRVPDDWRGMTVLKADDGSNGHVELIQRHHRLAAAPPSYHYTGQRYKTYDQCTGQSVPLPPMQELPKLPDVWLDGLRVDATKAVSGEATDETAEQFAAEHTSNAQPWHLTKYVVPPVRKATAETRNAAFDALHEAARWARVGWYPWATAVAEIEAAARDSYAQRDSRFDEADFARSARYAVDAANAEDLADLEGRAKRRLAQERNSELADRTLAPGGRWHPDTLDEKLRALPVEPGDDCGGEDDVPSWQPVDIARARRGAGAAPPTILKRSDGACLFYRGKVHSVHGESESGKSWLVQCAAAECLLNGEPVLYIDFEDEAGAVAERLIRLGVPAEIVENTALFMYVHPEAPPTTDAERAAFHALLASTYSFAVIDGVTDSMGMFGLSANDADDVARWHRVLPKAIARDTNAAVACVDHVAKDTNTRGRFALGSQHKIPGLSGAAYVVEMEQPFAVGQAGVASVRVGKDRPGRVRGLGGRWRKSDRTQHVADLHLDSTDADRSVWALEMPHGIGKSTDIDDAKSTKTKKTFRPAWFMEQVSRYWEEADDPADRTNNKTVNAMCQERKEQGKTQHREHWRNAIKFLVDEGFAKTEKGARDSEIHVVVKPYRQHEDPQCDAYSDTAEADVENWKRKLSDLKETDET